MPHRVPKGLASADVDATALLKHLLDPERLAVVGRVAAGPADAARIASDTGVRERAVLAALAPLVQAGLVTQDDGGYRLDAPAWRALAVTLPAPPPPDPGVMHGMTQAEGEILGRFFRGTRLVEIPVTRAKRLVVLERLALEFVPGTRYPEAEVNTVLAVFNDDTATLRRALVDEGFMDRADGWYWRRGGRVAIDEP